ncbi:MAG: lysophospholipid acyltransferase family protein [Dysgonamonadaceae bacterium]
MRKFVSAFICSFIYGIVYLISLLPMPVLYKISDTLYILLFYFIPYRKAVVVQNLSRSFSDMNYREIESTMKRFYRSFCDNLVEILKSISISPVQQANKITLVNFDIVRKQIAAQTTVIASMGHCGNWEIVSILPYMLNLNCYAVYKPLRGKIVDYLFLKIRSRFGMQLIPAKSVARHLIMNQDIASIYFFLADQCPKNIDKEYQFDFLHQVTGAFAGIEKLACSTHSAVVYIHVTKLSRGKYQLECKDINVEPELLDKKAVTARYIQLLERNIQEQPSGWLWTHKRWKR